MMFTEMNLETVEKVMTPKVKGSIYLDDNFHDSPLELSIVFSSVALNSDIKGQSVHGVANTSMYALAA